MKRREFFKKSTATCSCWIKQPQGDWHRISWKQPSYIKGYYLDISKLLYESVGNMVEEGEQVPFMRGEYIKKS